MIDVDEIPDTGVLLLSVSFDGYKPTYQNDSRRKLEKIIEQICKEENLEVESFPISFSLIRTIAGGKTRATGAQYQYGYSNMKGNDLKIIYKKLLEKSLPWWKKIQIMIAINVEGLE